MKVLSSQILQKEYLPKCFNWLDNRYISLHEIIRVSILEKKKKTFIMLKVKQVYVGYHIKCV